MDSVSELRVAIIGSGMAGLVIAHLLNGDRKGGYAVTVFESVGPALPNAYDCHLQCCFLGF